MTDARSSEEKLSARCQRHRLLLAVTKVACIDIVDTGHHIPTMSKASSSTQEGRGAATVAVAERLSAADTKGSINLRIEAHTRQLIDDAAAILGKTRTEFMVDSARRQAIHVLLDQRSFVLDSGDVAGFFGQGFDLGMVIGVGAAAVWACYTLLLRRVPAWQV